MTVITEAGSGFYRLFAWLSPGFPTGAFSYSHGLETAAADGAVRDRGSLESWIAAVLTHGSGRVDADILRDAYRAGRAGDAAAFACANRRGLAYRGTAELALESAAQGEAMLTTLRAAWPESAPGREVDDGAICHAAIVGWAAARAGVSLIAVLVLYLQSLGANLMSAGLRLGLIGQTDGQRILAALEPVVAAAAAAAITRDEADFGAVTFAGDLASMAHETLYTRLFRS
jgi:urease accessory protein